MEARSVEDVEKVIRHAKLDPNHLYPVAQNLYFGNRLMDQSEIRLMEVPSHLASLLTEGQNLVIRGDGEDSAVLCTANVTFDVKEAETSNGLLLLEGLHIPKDNTENGNPSFRQLRSLHVESICHSYLELRECKPRLSKLRRLLENSTFAGMGSITDASKGFSTQQLLDRIQCSEKELFEGLKEIRAVCIQPQGEWYLLNQDYHMRVLSHICNFVSENSWSFDNVNKAETLDALSELEPVEIVEQIFDMYFSPKSTNHGIHRDKLCRFFGEYLLQTGTVFNLTEFMSMWSQSMPEAENDDEGFQPEILHLRGLALVNTSSTPHTIRSFPESVLPEGIHDRLEMLFRAQEKWTVEDIAPYVECLTTPVLNVNGLLTKYGRAANVGGKKMFCSKHGK